jgi:glutaredoxin 3
VATVRIYTTRVCPYCVAVKALFQRKKVAFEEIDVTGDDAARAWLRETTGQRTVPQVMIDGRSYGGFTDVAELDREGTLDRILAGQHPETGDRESGAEV